MWASSDLWDQCPDLIPDDVEIISMDHVPLENRTKLVVRSDEFSGGTLEEPKPVELWFTQQSDGKITHEWKAR